MRPVQRVAAQPDDDDLFDDARLNEDGRGNIGQGANRYDIEQFISPHGACDEIIDGEDVSTLRLVASAGALLTPDLHEWTAQNVLKGRGYVLDNWWQKELAAPVIGTLPCTTAHLGRVGKMLPGVVADVVSLDDGSTVSPLEGGLLILRRPIPYMLHTVWGDDEAYRAYWERYPGTFTCGDMAFYDEEGYFGVLGHVEDYRTLRVEPTKGNV